MVAGDERSYAGRSSALAGRLAKSIGGEQTPLANPSKIGPCIILAKDDAPEKVNTSAARTHSMKTAPHA
jgi:hypothetical protein